MKAFVITLYGHEYSEAVANRCIESAENIGRVYVQRFFAVDRDNAIPEMKRHGLKWTWAGKPYPGALEPRIGCAMSHYLLWLECVRTGPMLILEHDSVFIREFSEFEFAGICQINDPRGATPRGDWWSDQMSKRGAGVFQKTKVLEDPRPDGLAGNSAYVIKPWAAQKLIEKARDGLWPNDALMCRQFFPWLQELYPFITRVEQTMSTTQ